MQKIRGSWRELPYCRAVTTATPQSVRSSERFSTKREVADHLGFSPRWVELQVAKGMPSHKWGGRRRFKLSKVERWLRTQEKRAA